MFVVVKAYPYEDQRAGVSNFVLPLWHLDHGKLSWTGTLAQNLPDLSRTQQSIDITSGGIRDTRAQAHTHIQAWTFLFIQVGALMFSHISVTCHTVTRFYGVRKEQVLAGCVCGTRVVIVCASSSWQLFPPSTLKLKEFPAGALSPQQKARVTPSPQTIVRSSRSLQKSHKKTQK